MLTTDTCQSVFYIREFRDEDISLIGDCVFGNIWKELPDEVKPYAYTAVYNGEVIAIGGISIFWKGVGEAWIFIRPIDTKIGFILARNLRRKMLELAEKYQLVRVQATVDKSFIQGLKLMKVLGFQPEGVLRRYLYGERDAFIMAYIVS